jgi:predicted DNA-binding antitoxin AbrB/MazE fold protein
MQQQVNDQTIEAVFENGVFRPLDPVNGSIVEGQRVQLTVRADKATDEEDPLAMLTNFWEGMSEEEIQEIERIMLDRSNWRSGTVIQ